MKQTRASSDTLFHRDLGHGRPVVLLHSSASSGSQWAGLAEQLSRSRRVIVPDLPGYGKSAVAEREAPLSLDAEAEAVFDLIETLGEPVDLVGHSFGGAVAVKIALRWPEAIRTLTVVEPVLFHLLRQGDLGDRSLLWQIKLLSSQIVSSIMDRQPDRGMQQFVDFWNGSGAWNRMSPELRETLSGRIGQVQNNFVAVSGESWRHEDCGRISCPVLAIMGDRSCGATRRVLELLVPSLPDVTLQTIEGAGHMAPVTHAEAVNALIVDHLREPLRVVSEAPQSHAPMLLAPAA